MYMKDEKGKGASFHCDWSRWIQIAVDGAVELLIAPGTELKGEHTGRFIFDEYRKIASSNTSRLEVHVVGFFRLLIKGIFGPYVLLPFDRKIINEH